MEVFTSNSKGIWEIVAQVCERNGLSYENSDWIGSWETEKLRITAQEHYRLWMTYAIILVSTITILYTFIINLVLERKRLESMVKGWWCQVMWKKQCLAGLLKDGKTMQNIRLLLTKFLMK